MIEGVSRQLFKQFAECVRAELATPLAAAPAQAPAPPSDAKPVRALPLLFKWLSSALLDLIRRLTRRSPAR